MLNHHEFTRRTAAHCCAPQVPHQHSSHLPGVVPTSPRCPRGPRPQGPAKFSADDTVQLQQLKNSTWHRRKSVPICTWMLMKLLKQSWCSRCTCFLASSAAVLIYVQGIKSSCVCLRIPSCSIPLLLWDKLCEDTEHLIRICDLSSVLLQVGLSRKLWKNISIGWPPLAMFLHWKAVQLKWTILYMATKPRRELDFWVIFLNHFYLVKCSRCRKVHSPEHPVWTDSEPLRFVCPSQTYSKHDERRRPRTRHCAPNGPPRPTLGMRCLRALKSCKEPKPSHTSQRFLKISMA